MLSTTAFLALAVQCAASIHPSTSLDVARVESGFHPYAIAEILPDSRGVISHFPMSLPEAIRLTGRLLSAHPASVPTGRHKGGNDGYAE